MDLIFVVSNSKGMFWPCLDLQLVWNLSKWRLLADPKPILAAHPSTNLGCKGSSESTWEAQVPACIRLKFWLACLGLDSRFGLDFEAILVLSGFKTQRLAIWAWLGLDQNRAHFARDAIVERPKKYISRNVVLSCTKTSGPFILDCNLD